MIIKKSDQLTIGKVFLFWAPLALMWIIMGIELPAVNAIISRLPAPKENLAAFGVTFAIALIIEGPIIQLLTAGTALSNHLENYKRLLRFMHIMAGGLTGIHLLIGATPLYGFLTRTILGIPEHLIGPSRESFLLMLPWSAAVGYRRLWQGVLIRYGRTGAVPIIMVLRIAVTGVILGTGLSTGFLSGASIGGLSLSAGVTTGAVSAFLFCRSLLRKNVIKPAGPEEKTISWKGLLTFYIPLALTSFILLAVRPIITAGIARAPQPLDSLALWPVIHSFLFLFTSVALSYQEVVVALLEGDDRYRVLKRFTWMISVALMGVFFLVPLLDLDTVWFRTVVGVPSDLMPLVRAPMYILPFMPFLLSQTTWYRGIQVKRRVTMNITKGVLVNGVVLTALLFSAAELLPVSGVIIAAGALTAAHLLEMLFLRMKTERQNRVRPGPRSCG
jgi:hypothetical protein